jgi:ABC-type nitrate/sulfonate/bicarbonate transport system permease component
LSLIFVLAYDGLLLADPDDIEIMNIEPGTGNGLSGMWKWSLRLGSFAALAIVWELLARNVNNLLMPTFTATLAALVRLLMTRRLWEALWLSNQAMVLGFTLAALFGISIGLLMGRYRRAEKIINPYLSILLVTPMSAVIPILVMALGLGLVSRVIVVFSFAFVTITVNTRAGVRMIEPGWLEMARAFGSTERQLWLKILLRGSLPAILTGLRLGLNRAISGMIAMELLLIAVGIGRLILDFQGYFEAANLYATVVVIIIEAVILTQLCQQFERRITPWAGQVISQ